MEIDRSTGALRGLAGLAPAPGDIFVYLKKDQVDAAGSTTGAAAQQIQAPREWTDWLTTMFNQADETGLAPNQIMGERQARRTSFPRWRSTRCPACAAISFPPTARSTPRRARRRTSSSAGRRPTRRRPTTTSCAGCAARLDEVQQTIGTKVDISDADLLAQYQTQRYQPFMVLENVTPYQVDKIQAAGLEAKGFGFQTAPLRIYPRGHGAGARRSAISRATSSATAANT